MKKQILIILLASVLLSGPACGQEVNRQINLGEKFTVHSELLGQDREIYVRLPQHNGTGSSRPVHFILDAEMTFLPYCGMVRIMSLGEQLPEPVVVGITNINRFPDMDPGDRADKFLGFIVDELAPHIEAEYGGGGEKVIAGYSLAGNFVIYAFLNAYDFFDGYISGSPYRLEIFGEDDLDFSGAGTVPSRTLYTSMGEGDRPDQYAAYQAFCSLLDERAPGWLVFRHETEEARHHDNNVILNWMKGLEYIYRDWEPQKSEQ